MKGKGTFLNFIQMKMTLGNCLKFHNEKLKIFTGSCTFPDSSIQSLYFDPLRFPPSSFSIF